VRVPLHAASNKSLLRSFEEVPYVEMDLWHRDVSQLDSSGNALIRAAASTMTCFLAGVPNKLLDASGGSASRN